MSAIVILLMKMLYLHSMLLSYVSALFSFYASTHLIHGAGSKSSSVYTPTTFFFFLLRPKFAIEH